MTFVLQLLVNVSLNQTRCAVKAAGARILDRKSFEKCFMNNSDQQVDVFTKAPGVRSHFSPCMLKKSQFLCCYIFTSALYHASTRLSAGCCANLFLSPCAVVRQRQ